MPVRGDAVFPGSPRCAEDAAMAGSAPESTQLCEAACQAAHVQWQILKGPVSRDESRERLLSV